jgi:HD-GYP domain-containing protein (c-di-GMP phosphodiesterase class II)
MMQLNSSYNFLQLYQRLSPEVKGHSLRVSLIMEMIVNELLKTNCRIPKRFGIETHDEIRRFARESGFYHDIGKIKVPAQLLSKQGDLTAPELEEIRRHTLYASEVLEPFVKDLSITEQPYFSAIIEVCTLHHERWDGTGYPYALSGEDIPFFSRGCAPWPTATTP